MKPAVGELSEFVLFCANLQGQISEKSLPEVKAKNAIVWFGVKDAKDIWQPVDNGYGALYKRLISQIQDEMLESDKNIDLRLGNSEKKLTASDRRILITHWVVETHEHLQSADYNKVRDLCFEKTRCLITADGSNDTKINPEGLINYAAPKPLPVQISEDAINCLVFDKTFQKISKCHGNFLLQVYVLFRVSVELSNGL